MAGEFGDTRYIEQQRSIEKLLDTLEDLVQKEFSSFEAFAKALGEFTRKEIKPYHAKFGIRERGPEENVGDVKSLRTLDVRLKKRQATCTLYENHNGELMLILREK